VQAAATVRALGGWIENGQLKASRRPGRVEEPLLTVDVSGLIPPDDKGEFAFEVHEYIVQAVDRIARIRERDFEAALQSLKLDMVRYRVLVAVVRADRCDARGLSVLLGYDEPVVQRAVRELVAARLLERLAPKRRGALPAVAATPAGKAAYMRTIPAAERLNDKLVEGMDEEARRSLLRGLEKMLINLGAGPKDVIKAFYASQIPSEDPGEA
jgi:DNA-binding MarR family transcriptional regulator